MEQPFVINLPESCIHYFLSAISLNFFPPALACTGQTRSSPLFLGTAKSMNYPVDIIIPVWNRPVETRASLACLVEFSAQARILMINHGSERETERILEEFAEALDERAILVSPERNVGRVAALNLGLALATAPVLIVVQEGINVTAGWLDPILGMINDRPEAGIVVPVPGAAKRASAVASHTELDHGSFGFMAIRRELYLTAGGFDESMDACIWALRDYTRKGEKAGYRTFSCKHSRVNLSELQEYGSNHLREERIRQGELSYCSRWGGGQKFCIVFSGDEADFQSQEVMGLLLKAARQGSEVICIVGHRLRTWLRSNALVTAHQNLRFEGLPLFFGGSSLLGRINRIVRSNSEISLVNVPHDFDKGITLCDFSRILEDRQSKYFS